MSAHPLPSRRPLTAQTAARSPLRLALLCLLWACVIAGCANLGKETDAEVGSLNSDTDDEDTNRDDEIAPFPPDCDGASCDEFDLTPPIIVLDYEPGSFCSGAVNMEGTSTSGSWSMAATTGPATASTGTSIGGSFALISGPAWLLMRDATLLSTPVCGDGLAEAPETCDTSSPPVTCADFVLQGRAAVPCSSACTYDTSVCVQPPPEGCECTVNLPVDAVCADFGFAGDGTSPVCGTDCRFDLSACSLPPVINPTAADTFACGTSGGIPVCWGQNDSDILTLPAFPLSDTCTDCFSAGNGFNAGIFDDPRFTPNILHYHAVTPLNDGASDLTTASISVDAVRSSANIFCTGVDVGGAMDVSCYARDPSLLTSAPPASISDFALSDQMLCAILPGGSIIDCVPMSGAPPIIGPISLFDSTDSAQKLVVHNNVVCLVHPSARTLQGSPGIGNIACWRQNATFAAPINTQSIGDVRVHDLAASQGSNLICATLAETLVTLAFGNIPSGEVFCWQDTGTGLTELGRVEAAPGVPFNATSLTISGAYVCANDITLGLHCAPLTADPPSHEGQRLVPTDRFLHVAMDPNPGTLTGCAVRDDGAAAGTGSVVCWGANAPLNIPIDTNLVQVAISNGYICGLASSGQVSCVSGFPPVETDFSAIVASPALDSGVPAMCGLRTNGSLLCWDALGYAQLTELGPFSKVSVSDGFACAIDSNDTPQCFGFSDGNGVPPGLDPPAGITALDLSVSASFACAIDTDQTLKCWGSGAPSIDPADAQDPFTQVITSSDTVCAVEDPTGPAGPAASIICWGAAELSGQEMRQSIQSVSMGDAGTCALRRNKYLACWGAYALGFR